ncbi:2-hydroxyhepta-2,4-diene-1,7-dioate isomerase [Mycobacterium sherrisii]|uniref:2-hydroxyhepta-2,4-diene-1,7-dioate isomerase n=1 Tax=Mycobacterium sherrisii TaxID=243061 RepID=A0A1E3SY85_9MYCO|nr:fumarylacetoacetate hydrolase family protein [Mycobacterium sherrisii]ODR07085.1 2-hydroxyhepta-2,4-diene-1,7-dioate isomerase [Mycobacterium sherrisii]
MRWVTYRTPDGDRVGLVVGEDIYSLPTGVTMVELVSRGPQELAEAGQRARRAGDTVRLADVELAAPIPRPPAVRDCLCFLDHMRNCQQALGGDRVLKDAWYRIPAFYFACPASVLGPHDDAPIASGSAWQDFELEIAAVIGVGGKDMSVAEAQSAIIGYTIFNDWSARDLQALELQLGIGQGKGKDSALTLGPYLVTPDELEPYLRNGRLDLRVSAAVNGQVIGEGSTGSMDWTFAEVISFASRGVTLNPGDVFGSGTVPTCTLLEHLDINDLESFRGWLGDGDVVTLTVEGLGTTRQTVRSSPAPQPLPARDNPDAAPAPPRVNRARALVPYTRGLHEVGTDVWAWTLPDGGFGWSNAGLVAGDGASMLVDTLFDLRLTREMLTAMQPITDRHPIRDVLITHSNGDHTHGNQLLDPAVRILAATGTAESIAHELAPEMFAFFQSADFGPTTTPYLRERLGQFFFGDGTTRNADETFEGQLSVEVGGRRVDIYDLGPAHTAADSVVHVPDAGVLFGGDLLFFGCTPIVWAGPIANWVAACDAMIALDASVVVPGHGPVGDGSAIKSVREYLTFVSDYADCAWTTGQTFQEAAARIDLGEYRDWLDAERIVVNVYQRYREIDPRTPQLGIRELFDLQAEWQAAQGGSR